MQKNISRIFNIGTGKGSSVLEVLKTFEEVNNIKLNYKTGPRREGDIEQTWADSTLFQKELGFKTEFSLKDALIGAWRWQKHLAY